MSMPRNVRCTLAYRGTDFRGFAENEGVATVAGTLRAALEQVLREPIELHVAGRTDAGVHAASQVVSFRTTSARFDVDRLRNSLNHLCGPDIAVAEVAVVDDEFHARFSARQRRYRYTVLNRLVPDPLRRDLEWHVPQELDLDAMGIAASALVGEHDFSSFCRRPKDQPDASLRRRVVEATWVEPEPELEPGRLVFTVAANAFCHQMVRSMVGYCVAVGRGALPADGTAAVLEARNRSAAGLVAPPNGLVLTDVVYSDSD